MDRECFTPNDSTFSPGVHLAITECSAVSGYCSRRAQLQFENNASVVVASERKATYFIVITQHKEAAFTNPDLENKLTTRRPHELAGVCHTSLRPRRVQCENYGGGS